MTDQTRAIELLERMAKLCQEMRDVDMDLAREDIAFLSASMVDNLWYRERDAMARANTLRTDKPAADQDG